MKEEFSDRESMIWAISSVAAPLINTDEAAHNAAMLIHKRRTAMTNETQCLFNRLMVLIFALAIVLLLPVPSKAISLLTESFEGGQLDPHISMTTVGGYTSTPGIQAFTNFGSANAFGFGRSDCAFNCFDAHVTSLIIDLGAPTLVSTLSFKEMELFGNWGSGGAIFVDGVLFGTTHYDYGRLPYNDLTADQTFRSHTFDINRTVQTIELRVRDITNQSEIFIDDINVNGSPTTAVPEANSGILLLVGIAILWFGHFLRSTTFQSRLMKQIDEAH